ncbi:unannotated protein [freshwater metagenome]|uniref:Unannotated protein n=1 Tax=freshwater metagenome TaxID=449393 RepID=A0A6J6GGT8_9ZZZZ
MALMSPFTAVACAIAASTSSRADTSPFATIAAWSSASRSVSLLMAQPYARRKVG